jgi:hypothetical protein
MRNMQNLIYFSLLIFALGCKSQASEKPAFSVAENNPVSLKKIGQIQPRHASEISGSYWGIQASTLEPEILEKAAEIGVKWTRLGASWSSIEKQKGEYDWSETDEAFAAVLDAGITPFVTLGSSNLLYVDSATYDNPELAEIYGYFPQPPTVSEAAMQGWLTFVEAAINRYKDQVRYWEIWNEPNHRKYWGGDPNPEEYGQLVNLTAKLIKELQPDAVIIAGSTAGIQVDFTDRFLSQGNAELVDIISYHNYAPTPEERIYKAVDLLAVMDKHNPEMELWQGECGYPSHSSTRDYRGRAPWGLNIQAKWLLRQALVDTYFCEATLSNYFKLVHMGGRGESHERNFMSSLDSILGVPERGGSRVRTKGVNEKCILSNPDLEPKPAYYAYQNLCAAMDASYKVHKVSYDVEVKDAGIFYGIGEEDDAFPSVPLVASFQDEAGNALIAYWLPWNAQEYLPELAQISLRLENTRFEDPVLLNPLDGSVYEIEEHQQQAAQAQFAALPMGDFPMMIMERKEVNL